MGKKMRDEIIHGKNIGIYLAISLSILLSLAAFFNLVKPGIITKLTLMILSFILIYLIQHNQAFEEFVTSKFTKWITWNDEMRREMKEKLKSSEYIQILAISPLNILSENSVPFLNILKKRGEIDFLVVNPESQSMKVIRTGREENFNDGKLFLEKIQKDPFVEFLDNKKLKIKLLDYVPSHIITIVDGEKNKGAIFATMYSYEQNDPYRPSEIITPCEMEKYSFFLKEFKSLWEKGEDFNE